VGALLLLPVLLLLLLLLLLYVYDGPHVCDGAGEQNVTKDLYRLHLHLQLLHLILLQGPGTRM